MKVRLDDNSQYAQVEAEDAYSCPRWKDPARKPGTGAFLLGELALAVIHLLDGPIGRKKCPRGVQANDASAVL